MNMNVNENQKSYILDENFILSISQSDHVKNRLFLHKKQPEYERTLTIPIM